MLHHGSHRNFSLVCDSSGQVLSTNWWVVCILQQNRRWQFLACVTVRWESDRACCVLGYSHTCCAVELVDERRRTARTARAVPCRGWLAGGLTSALLSITTSCCCCCCWRCPCSLRKSFNVKVNCVVIITVVQCSSVRCTVSCTPAHSCVQCIYNSTLSQFTA